MVIGRTVRSVMALTGVALMTSATASAQEAPQPPAAATSALCFDLVFPPGEGQLHTPFLLNRCTGATWLLVKTILNDEHGKPSDRFGFEWRPLTVQTDGAGLTASNLAASPMPSLYPPRPAKPVTAPELQRMLSGQ